MDYLDKLLRESLIQWIDSLSMLPEAEMLAMIMGAANSEDTGAEAHSSGKSGRIWRKGAIM